MNSLAIFLLKDDQENRLTKVAYTDGMRRFGVSTLENIGKGLSTAGDNPLLGGAMMGGLGGGIYGASTADTDMGENRLRRAVEHAMGGALGGGLTGKALSSGMRNLGRYGKDIEEAAKNVEDTNLKGAVGDIVNKRVLFPENRYGGTVGDDAIEELVEKAQGVGSSPSQETLEEVADMAADVAGRRGSRATPAQMMAALAGGSFVGGKAVEKYNEPKYASFANLAAQAGGQALRGAGHVMTSPALAGAAVGATAGAITAGEGNRLQGALGGAALGAGAGAGLKKLAPDSFKNMSHLGGQLKKRGGEVLKAAKDTGDGATTNAFNKLKEIPDVLKSQGRIKANRAASEGAEAIGMTGMQALGTGAAATTAAGVIGGATMQRPNQQNTQK